MGVGLGLGEGVGVGVVGRAGVGVGGASHLPKREPMRGPMRPCT